MLEIAQPSEDIWTHAWESVELGVRGSLNGTYSGKSRITEAILRHVTEKLDTTSLLGGKATLLGGGQVILRDMLDKLISVTRSIGQSWQQDLLLADHGGIQIPLDATLFIVRALDLDFENVGQCLDDLVYCLYLIDRLGRMKHCGSARQSSTETVNHSICVDILAALAGQRQLFSEGITTLELKPSEIHQSLGICSSTESQQQRMMKLKSTVKEAQLPVDMDRVNYTGLSNDSLLHHPCHAKFEAFRRTDDDTLNRLKLWLHPENAIVLASIMRGANADSVVDTLSRWLYHNDDYTKWAAQHCSAVLHISGPTGFGKSYISAVLGYMWPNLDTKMPHLGYYFCQYAPPNQGPMTAARILANVIWQLSIHPTEPSLVHQAASNYWSKAVSLRTRTSGTLKVSVCIDILLEMLEHNPIILIIDGIDVLHTEQRMLLVHKIQYIMSQSKNVFKLVLTSRHIRNLTTSLSPVYTIRLDIDRPTINVDLLLSDAKVPQSSPEAMREWIEQLCNAQPPFKRDNISPLWISLQTARWLRDGHQAVREFVDWKPDVTLNETYRDLYNLAISSKHSEVAINTFKWLLYAKSQIDLHALLLAVSKSTNSSNLTIEDMIDACQGLIEVRKSDNFPAFVHPSVKEYLSRQHALAPSFALPKMAMICLELCASMHEFPKTSLMNYAALHWIQHCADAEPFRDIQLSTRLAAHLENICDATAFLGNASRQEQSVFPTVNLKLNTPLLLAAAFGFASILESSSWEPKVLNQTTENGETALHLASKHGHTTAVQILLRLGVDVDASANDGTTPLVNAAGYGHVEICQLLFEQGADPAWYRSLDTSPFKYACQNGEADVAMFLLEQTIPLSHDIATKDLWTTAVDACSAPLLSVLAKKTQLAHHDVESSTPASFGATQLFPALTEESNAAFICRGATLGSSEVVVWLLSNNHNTLPYGQITILERAVEAGHEFLFRQLAAEQAFACEWKSRDGCISRLLATAAKYSQMRMARFLLRNETHRNGKDVSMLTQPCSKEHALHTAIQQGQRDLVDMLHSFKAHLYMPQRENAFNVALCTGSHAVVFQILSLFSKWSIPTLGRSSRPRPVDLNDVIDTDPLAGWGVPKYQVYDNGHTAQPRRTPYALDELHSSFLKTAVEKTQAGRMSKLDNHGLDGTKELASLTDFSDITFAAAKTVPDIHAITDSAWEAFSNLSAEPHAEKALQGLVMSSTHKPGVSWPSNDSIDDLLRELDLTSRKPVLSKSAKDESRRYSDYRGEETRSTCSSESSQDSNNQSPVRLDELQLAVESLAYLERPRRPSPAFDLDALFDVVSRKPEKAAILNINGNFITVIDLVDFVFAASTGLDEMVHMMLTHAEVFGLTSSVIRLALCEASRSGHLKLVQMLISQSVMTSEAQLEALCVAVKRDHIDIIDEILRCSHFATSANVYIKAMLLATESAESLGFKHIVKIVDGALSSHQVRFFKEVLAQAAEQGLSHVVELSLDRLEDVDLEELRLGFFRACRHKRQGTMSVILSRMSTMMDINQFCRSELEKLARDRRVRSFVSLLSISQIPATDLLVSVLEEAVRQDMISILDTIPWDRLIEPKPKDVVLANALCTAAELGMVRICNTLIAAGANVNIKCSRRHITALDLCLDRYLKSSKQETMKKTGAQTKEHTEMALKGDDTHTHEAALCLIKTGATMNTVSATRWLEQTISRAKSDIIHFLLQSHAQVTMATIEDALLREKSVFGVVAMLLLKARHLVSTAIDRRNLLCKVVSILKNKTHLSIATSLDHVDNGSRMTTHYRTAEPDIKGGLFAVALYCLTAKHEDCPQNCASGCSHVTDESSKGCCSQQRSIHKDAATSTVCTVYSNEQSTAVHADLGILLLHAAASCYYDTVQLLLDHGVDANWRDHLGTTALHIAVERGGPNMCRKLLKAGAAIDAVDSKGRTPLSIAIADGKDEIISLLRRGGAVMPDEAEHAKILDETRVHDLIADNDEEALQKLLESRTISQEAIRAILLYASGHSSESLLDSALGMCADITLINLIPDKDDVMTSPLHVAISKGQYFHLRTLLDHGLDPTQDFGSAPNPLILAMDGHEVTFLKELLSLPLDVLDELLRSLGRPKRKKCKSKKSKTEDEETKTKNSIRKRAPVPRTWKYSTEVVKAAYSKAVHLNKLGYIDILAEGGLEAPNDNDSLVKVFELSCQQNKPKILEKYMSVLVKQKRLPDTHALPQPLPNDCEQMLIIWLDYMRCNEALFLEACIDGYSKVLTIGLDDGIRPNVEVSGCPALHFAAAYGRLSVVKLLVERGALHDCDDDSGEKQLVKKCHHAVFGSPMRTAIEGCLLPKLIKSRLLNDEGKAYATRLARQSWTHIMPQSGPVLSYYHIENAAKIVQFLQNSGLQVEATDGPLGNIVSMIKGTRTEQYFEPLVQQLQTVEVEFARATSDVVPSAMFGSESTDEGNERLVNEGVNQALLELGINVPDSAAGQETAPARQWSDPNEELLVDLEITAPAQQWSDPLDKLLLELGISAPNSCAVHDSSPIEGFVEVVASSDTDASEYAGEELERPSSRSSWEFA